MRRRRASAAAVGLAVAAVAAYLAITFWQVARVAGADETRPADVIIIFGAAEYVGRPSPVLRARLEHGLELYHRGLAPWMITTGGHGQDVSFSEGEVGRDFLIAHGVPAGRVIAETQSDDTDESAQRVARIMRTNGMRTCLAVSDGYHMFRVKKMMASQGIAAYGSPRPALKPLPWWERGESYSREVLSITLWRLHLT